ncbi:MAG: ATP synthase F1 subunit delta [Cyanobacteria bacterium P01_C01_bin.89]
MATNSTTISGIAEPYAQALMSLAQSNNAVDKFAEDAASLREAISASEQFEAFLANPFVDPDAKKGVLAKLAEKGLHPIVGTFLKLLVDRKRIALLEEICRKFQALYREATNTVLAEVVSVVELSDEQRTAVIDRVKSMTSAEKVEIETQLDPSLLGGVIIKVGSQVVDASLRGQLRRIGLSLSSPV